MPCTRPGSRRTKLLFAPKSWCRNIYPVLKLAATAGDHFTGKSQVVLHFGHQNGGTFQVFFKEQLNKLQKGSESAFVDRRVGADVGLYYKKYHTWERCAIRQVHAQVIRLRVEAGLQVERVVRTCGLCFAVAHVTFPHVAGYVFVQKSKL